MSQVVAYFPLILKGMLLTVEVALLSLLIAILLGLIGAVAKLSKSPIATTIAGTYTTIIRGIPDLVLMTLIFFGGQGGIRFFGRHPVDVLRRNGRRRKQGFIGHAVIALGVVRWYMTFIPPEKVQLAPGQPVANGRVAGHQHMQPSGG